MSSRKQISKTKRNRAIQLERKNALQLMGITKKSQPVPRGQKKKGRNRQRRQRIPFPLRNGPTVTKSNYLSKFPLGNNQRSGFGSAANRKRITVCESEYIGEVTVANEPNFNIAGVYPMNPGQATTFPWLSTLAKLYEKYRFLELVFTFKPEVTQYTSNVNTGKVVMSIDYDASDPAPGNKQQMEDTVPHSDGMPYQSIMLQADPKEMYQKSDAKFVRPGGLPGSTSIVDYDCGNFFLATQGQTANSVLGELHVYYCVELSVPVLENSTAAPVNNSVSQFIDTTVWTTATPTVMSFATAATAGGKGPYITANGVNCVKTAGLIVPPPGNYLVMVNTIANDATTDELVQVALSVNLNANALSQLASNNPYTMWFLGNVQQGVSLSYQGFVQCNGTDYLSVSGVCDFSSGTLTTVSTLTLVAI